MKNLIAGFTAFVMVIAVTVTPLGEILYGNLVNKPLLTEAVESDIEYPFGYENSDVFVSECLLNRAKTLEGEPISSVNLGYDVVKNYAYKDVAEAIIEDEWLLGHSTFWKNLGLALDGDFVSMATWRQEIYETIIMDWLTYNFETDEFKSEFTEDSAKYAWKIIKYLEKSGDIYDENDLGNMSVEKAVELLDDDFYKQNEILGKMNNINTVISDVATVAKTSYDYYKRLSSVLAAQEACQSRVDFLMRVKSVSDDQDLCNAIDVVVSKLNMSIAEITANEGGYIMLKHICKSAWGLITDTFKIPVLKEVEIGKCTFDWLLNTENNSDANLKLTILYIINSDFTKAYTLIRDEYDNNRTEYNAQIFNNAFIDYTNFQAYASSITKNEMATMFYEGAYNQLVNLFDKDRVASIEDFCRMFDTEISIAKTKCNLVGKWYNLYNDVLNKNNEMDWFYDDSVHVTGIHFEKEEVEWGTKDDDWFFANDAVIEPSDASDARITYTSSDESVLSIKEGTSFLNVDIKKAGTAVITATSVDGGFTDTLTVNVVEGHGKDGVYFESTEDSNNYAKLSTGDTFTVGYLSYKVIADGEVSVIGCENSVENVVVPKYVYYRGYSYLVTKIADGGMAGAGAAYGVFSYHSTYGSRNRTLKTIQLPDSIIYIGKYTFVYCSSLEEIKIPTHASIGMSAFDFCYAKIICHEDSTACNYVSNYYYWNNGYETHLNYQIENHSFIFFEQTESDNCITRTYTCTGCDLVRTEKYSILNNGTLEVASYSGNYTEVAIPEEVDGRKVTSIGAGAFSEFSKLSSIIIPDGITKIGSFAFEDCTSLTSVTIPDSVTSIGDHALGYCYDDGYGHCLVDNFMLYVYSGTAGEKYAIDNNIDYVLLEKPDSPVSGKITQAGSTDLTGTAITLTDLQGKEYTAKVSADGTFSADGLTSGEYTLTAAKENCAPRTYNITVGEKPIELDVELHLYGDVNADGKVTVSDVAKVNSHVKKKAELTDYDFAVADVNKDGKLSVSDSAKINAHMKGKSLLW